VVTENGLRSDDALQLQHAATQELAYELVNPFAYEPAIAPHIAADLAGEQLSVDQIIAAFKQLPINEVDCTIIEGAGGWLVPLNAKQNLSDVAAELDPKVIVVVGCRLGCINHAMLTIESILNRGLHLAGWVANAVVPEQPNLEENIKTLQQRIPAPMLARVDFQKDPANLASLKIPISRPV